MRENKGMERKKREVKEEDIAVRIRRERRRRNKRGRRRRERRG